MKRELERQQWEADMGAAAERGPVGPVHFQSVVPGEIRELGTGYYRFSTDEEQRANQMSELIALRDHTADQRRRREALKKRREEAQEERIAKIRKRKGLATLETVEPATPTVGDMGSGGQAAVAATTEPELNSVDDLLAFYKTQAAAKGPTTTGL